MKVNTLFLSRTPHIPMNFHLAELPILTIYHNGYCHHRHIAIAYQYTLRYLHY